MKDTKITIFPADIATIKFNNKFTIKPGEPLKLTIKNGVAVKLNMEAPTNAGARMKFAAFSEDENQTISLEVETITRISSSTYIDDFEDVIKKNYIGVILYNANEKIRSICTAVGVNITFPPVILPFIEEDTEEGSGNNSLDDIISFKGND